MKKKIFALLSAALLLCGMCSTSAFAGYFVQDVIGIKYVNDAGAFATNEWIQANGLWYYMDGNGLCTNPAGALTPTQATAPATVNIFATAGFTPYVPNDNAVLQAGLANGLIGFDGAQYWASPAFSAMLAAQAPAPAAAQPTISVPAVNPLEEIVYIGETGTKYHHADCRTLKGVKTPVNLSDAVSMGRTPCKVCYK